ncbi:hypothetical protein PVAP13_3NG136602 [Panicum virgatum]|uniref:Uncharacterized protein n=1 Tax=Panicum virgatum TaxID=38727 RepID=A0A8T0UG82_PANVG|nr:hypothetical protein PVAP13_3NG136602 [Panicum virgatum]
MQRRRGSGRQVQRRWVAEAHRRRIPSPANTSGQFAAAPRSTGGLFPAAPASTGGRFAAAPASTGGRFAAGPRSTGGFFSAAPTSTGGPFHAGHHHGSPPSSFAAALSTEHQWMHSDASNW